MFDDYGKSITAWGSPGSANGEFNYPEGITVDKLGHVYVVDRENSRIEKLYIAKWKEFMSLSVSMKEIEEKWIPKAYAEDHPAKLIDHIDWLREIGFKDVDIIWKYYHLAVYGGYKE